MASPLSISSAHPHILFYVNKTTNLKALFTHGFDIQTTDADLLNKWVTYKFNICAVTNVEDYELWIYIQIDFQKFEAKHFNMLDSSTLRRIQESCYLHKIWININNGSDSFITAMLKAIASDWYDEWTFEQIK